MLSWTTELLTWTQGQIFQQTAMLSPFIFCLFLDCLFFILALQLSYRTISYHIISYHTVPYHIIPYYIISYHTILYYIISSKYYTRTNQNFPLLAIYKINEYANISIYVNQVHHCRDLVMTSRILSVMGFQ